MAEEKIELVKLSQGFSLPRASPPPGFLNAGSFRILRMAEGKAELGALLFSGSDSLSVLGTSGHRVSVPNKNLSDSFSRHSHTSGARGPTVAPRGGVSDE